MFSKIDSCKWPSYRIQKCPEILSVGTVHTNIVPIVTRTGQRDLAALEPTRCTVGYSFRRATTGSNPGRPTHFRQNDEAYLL
jgi:hypothetical protein